MNYLFTIAIASLLFISCSEDQYVRTYKVNKEFNKEVNEQASIPITWSAPISWIQPESLIPMSIASYKIPYYGYDPSKIDYADLSISIPDVPETKIGSPSSFKTTVNFPSCLWKNAGLQYFKSTASP